MGHHDLKQPALQLSFLLLQILMGKCKQQIQPLFEVDFKNFWKQKNDT